MAKTVKKTILPQIVQAEHPVMQRLRVGWRMVIIGSIMLALLIPTFFISQNIEERKTRRQSVLDEVAGQWSGGEMHLMGPVLTLPFKEFFKDEKGQTQFTIKHAHFMPESLVIKGTLVPEVRYRGIYQVVLYRTQLSVTGNFHFPKCQNLNLTPEQVMWEDAELVLGIQDVKGIQHITLLQWNQERLTFESGTQGHDILTSGIHVRVPLDEKVREYTFALMADLKGHDSLQFVPAARVNRVELASAWNSPSFIGTFLPEQREIKPDGFHAVWQVLDLNRNFPQSWIGEQSKETFYQPQFGVSLYQSVDLYQKVTRTVKYAFLFIALTFLAFFMIEILNWPRIPLVHPIQYLFIGVALVLFYSLVLSLSEHLGFAVAYALATLGVVGMITGYSHSVFKKITRTGLIAAIMLGLYIYLYFILLMEDYALLVGNLGLFVILAVVMYLTRKVDWYGLGKSSGK